MKRRPYIRKSSGRRWRPKEDAKLRASFTSLKDATKIKLRGRTPSAILNRVRAIGLVKPTRPWWNRFEDALLQREFKIHRADPKKIAIVGRNATAIRSRRNALGLSTRQYWTAAQIEQLRIQWSEADGKPAAVTIAGKTAQQIYSKLDHLGLLIAKRKRCKWTEAKIAELKRKLAGSGDPRLITINGYTSSQIQAKLFRVGGRIPRAYLWTSEQEESLARQWHASNDPAKVFIAGRTGAAVTARLKKLGLLKPIREQWSVADVALLRQQWTKFRDVDRILIPGRARNQVLLKLAQLRLLKSPRWTKSQLARLRASWNRTKDLKKIDIPGRTRAAIKARLIQLGIDVRNGTKTPWTAVQISSLKAQWQKHKTPSKVKVRGKSASAVTAKLIRLELNKPSTPHSEWSIQEQFTVLERRLQGLNAKQIAQTRVISRTSWGIAKWISRLKKQNLLTKEHLQSLRESMQNSQDKPKATAELDLRPLETITESLPLEFKNSHAPGTAELALPGAVRRGLNKLRVEQLKAIASQLIESLTAPEVASILRHVELTRMKGSTAIADSLLELERRLADPLLGSAKSSRVALVDAIVVCAYIPNHVTRLIA